MYKTKEKNNKVELVIISLLSIFMMLNITTFLQTAYPIYKHIGALIFVMTFILYVYNWFKNNEKKKRLLFYIISYLAVANLIVLIIYYVTKFVVLTDSYGLESILTQYSDWAKLIYFFICFSQPIMLPLPEPVTIMAGSAVFGPMLGAIIGFSGTILGIIVMFFIGRFASNKFIGKLINENSLDKFNRYVRKHETIVLIALFILPILPDEVICIGGGLSSIKPFKFIVIAVISKIITSFSLAYSLSMFNINFMDIMVLLVSVLVIFTLMRIIYDRLKK